ncbi:hypothetical protein E8E11_005767 [Didymella keratinophila]|nr:hypothetical protein E8E11_005767 [Didymella keratinophila]
MRFTTILHCFAVAATAAANICPILGPVFPKPKELQFSVIFQKSLEALHASLDGAFTSGNTTHGTISPNSTYSVQVFSATSKEPLFDYHRRGSDVLGNRTVNGDSVYRIASTSKLITVYLLLLQAGETIFSDKVTKYVPELAGTGYWDDITVGSLASHLGGVTAELVDASSLPGGDLNAELPLGTLPPLTASEIPKCSYGSGGCTQEVFLSDLISRRPVNLPNTTPGYSNAAFGTLGLVLEAAAGSTFEATLRHLLLEPLQLKATSISQPQDLSYAIIPGNATTSGWDINLSDAPGAAMGGFFSTPNDLSAIGRSILSSTLLPNATTRAWLKPTSFTSSLIGAVGRPWEIYRAVLDAKNNRVIDIYTKAGNLPGYASMLALIPDFDVGFTIMLAGEQGTGEMMVAGVITDELLPALEEAARAQADYAFAGVYTASNAVNSTIKLTTSPGVPGLSIEEWISNGTDLRRSLYGSNEFLQMFPSIVSDDGKEVSWRSTAISIPDTGSPFEACPSWLGIDRPTYGVYSLDHFISHIGDDGKAWAIEPQLLKIVLEKD